MIVFVSNLLISENPPSFFLLLAILDILLCGIPYILFKLKKVKRVRLYLAINMLIAI